MKAKNNWYEIVSKGAKAEVIMHGYIGPYDSISSKTFIKEWKEMEAKHTEIDINLNSGGGSIFEANPIFNAINNSKAQVSIIVSGMAASMGSIILQGASPGKRKAYKNARIMVHKPSGGAFGSAKKMRETADLLDSLEKTLSETYQEKTGQSEEVVNSWLQEGVDKWFTAKEAKAEGLIDEIIDEAPVKAPKSALAPEAMHEYFSNQFQAIYTKPKMKKSIFIALLASLAAPAFSAKLSEESSDEDILAGFKNALEDKDKTIQELKDKLTDTHTAAIEKMVNEAVTAGKILASQKEHYTKLAQLDFDSISAILTAMSPKASLTDAASRGADDSQEKADTARAGWDFRKWQKEDAKGLLKMQVEDPKRYNELKDSYGK